MKKIIFFAILLCHFTFCAFSQYINQLDLIGNPKKLENEFSSRIDQNGYVSAAIQVLSDMEGFQYDSFDGIVKDVIDGVGKDIVHLTSTERVLEIHKKGYKPLKMILSDYGIVLKPGEVWEITVSAKNDIKLPVNINLRPNDAYLIVDDIEMPNSETILLSPGLHRLRMMREGYETIEQSIVIDSDNQNLTFDLKPIEESIVNIESQPVGASVYLDNVKLGNTPLTVFFPTGIFPLELRKEGYLPITVDSFEVKHPEARRYFILEANMGLLTVNTDEGSSVFLNGVLTHNPKQVQLSPQVVNVEVVKPKADTLREQIIIKRYDDITLDMFPVVETGFLQIAAIPFNAHIEVLGDFGESYSSDGNFNLKEISVGTYKIIATASGYHERTDTIIIKKDITTKHQMELKMAGAEPFTTYAGIHMVFVDGGKFKMGCTSEAGICESDELPVRDITVNDYFMSKYEITQNQWFVVMGEKPSKNRKCNDCPVDNVTWVEIQEFLAKLKEKTGHNFRLPTEAEWEYAARGGNKSRSQTYSGAFEIDKAGWYDDNAKNESHPVGQKEPNEIGLFDLSGNVWEWCSDWYQADYYNYGTNINPGGPETGEYKLLRGGSYLSKERYCTLSNRNKCTPDKSYKDFGFRIVLTR
ncbi:MAG: SUMF1/EgtB/PvdO family nonheme iron enzyme [Bacteroidales bacterium]|nr:SUMF1/EgtB/PvdO family nonheme iron enzyme [Bacteroidales bacterium]